MAEPHESDEAPSEVEGQADGSDARVEPDAKPLSKKEVQKRAEAQARADLESLLGPDVRSPVGIPRDYTPTDSSLHELFHIELTDFAGPLDLLLYLIRKHELDIFDIPIKFITERYLELVDALKALEVDVAAEFLVMAAELIHIKSKMLLPAKEGVAVDDDEEDEGDPREELVRRLLEYQKYRDAAEQLADRDRLGRDVFARNPPSAEAMDELDPGLKSVSIFKLVELMAKLLRRVPTHHEIHFESVSIAERIHYVIAFGEARDGKFTIVQLLDGIVTRAEIVVTFIAVLEMIKIGLIRVVMEDLPSWRSARPKKNELGDGQHAVVAEEEAPLPIPEPADEGSAESARRLAAEIEAEAPELEALSSISAAPDDATPSAPPAPASKDDPLPEIWIQFTGKRFEGDILDDYQ